MMFGWLGDWRGWVNFLIYFLVFIFSSSVCRFSFLFYSKVVKIGLRGKMLCARFFIIYTTKKKKKIIYTTHASFLRKKIIIKKKENENEKKKKLKHFMFKAKWGEGVDVYKVTSMYIVGRLYIFSSIWIYSVVIGLILLLVL